MFHLGVYLSSLRTFYEIVTKANSGQRNGLRHRHVRINFSFLQYPTVVICPVQFYDRWNLPRILLNHNGPRSQKELQLADVFVNFLENNIKGWLSDMYLETITRQRTGTRFKQFMERNFTSGGKTHVIYVMPS